MEVLKEGTTIGGKTILDIVYPIDSIYISASSTNPADLFGGTWEQFAVGKTLIGYIGNTEYQESNDVIDGCTELLSTGGEKEHTLTIDEIPSHNHDYNSIDVDNPVTISNLGIGTKYTNASNETITAQTTEIGGNQSHNNCMPYITVSIWKRVA